ncbi:MAG: SDR family NAD(P)-dependent oxidoreductase [Bacilli bacterium]|nr:SDR family NAD(P)-dependent oxidoreductase [Bacilli bacterium]
MKKIIVVTGASSGMGRDFIKQIEEIEKVDEIWAIARSVKKLEELKEEIKTPVKIIPLDLAKKESFEEYKKIIEAEEVKIRILANCAGFGIFDHTENIDYKVLNEMVDLNCSSYVNTISISLPYIEEGGKIMNIASCAGFQPIPYIACYGATKAFVLSYGRALNVELKYRKIHVLTVTPFWTKTAFFDRAVDTDKKPVVIKYAAMYDPHKVMKKAIKDLYKKKEISCYGFKNNAQRILVRLLPKKMVMGTWMRQQKLNGTPQIRK